MRKDSPDIWIIDNFYRRFDLVRELALGAAYETNGPKAFYQGRNSLDVYYPAELFEKVRRRIGHFHISLTRTPTYNPSSTGRFRIAFGKHVEEDGGIHYDYPGAFAAVIYMNTPEQCEGRIGTEFWRHRATGTIMHPRVNMANKANFDLIRSVRMKSNRCLLFQADAFHSIHHNFGSTRETGRMVQLIWMFKGHSPNGINCC